MVAEINREFEDISRKLYRDSLNYCANFQLFPCDPLRNDSIESLARSALGEDAVVDGSQEATKKEVIKELRGALCYRGDYGSHPSLGYLDSPESKKDFDSVIAQIQEILDRSHRIASLQITDGHPFYPVFWDFAYLMESDQESMLFIASSSD